MAGTKKSNGLGAKARVLILSIAMVGTSLLASHAAVAHTKHQVRHSVALKSSSHHTASHIASHHTTSHHVASLNHGYKHLASTRRGHVRYASGYRHNLRMASYHYSGLQCVPYAREVSHIQLTGNAFLWWAEASGRYARGSQPVPGAVLNFRAIGRMPLGHVAVVTGVLDSRTILVTQANWVRGSITNDVTMQDVSPNNDWTQVQVELGDSRTWGAAYPTYGFIYNQPADSTLIAANAPATEVAEAPAAQAITTEAPNRNLQ
jgi:surface antigen